MNFYNIEAEVHRQLANGAYRVKAKILNPEVAMYINGMVIFAPNEKYPEWAVYTPKIYNARIIEFAGKSVLWQELQKVCIDTVKLYISDEQPLDINSLVGW